jgi:16S rRNA (guanine1207-N2)-methyltransferase
MRSARLDMALETGLFVLPAAGQVVVCRPHLGDDLSPLGRDRVVVQTGFRPDHDHFAGLGYAVSGAEPFAAAVVCLPRSKTQARAMIAAALASVVPGGPVLVDGQKTDGVDAVLKDCRAAGLQPGESLSKAHGKAFVLPAGPAPAGWAAEMHEIAGGFVTSPGVFSADAPDAGSTLLAAALPPVLKGRVLDLGAGWGFLARAVLERAGVTELHLVEAEAEALDCARLNITDPRAQFHWADATRFRSRHLAQAVVMNPPFHLGREADAGLGLNFLKAAHRNLAPDGVLYMVANRHLPYAATLAGLFRQVEELAASPAFRVTKASFPIRSR